MLSFLKAKKPKQTHTHKTESQISCLETNQLQRRNDGDLQNENEDN